MALTNVCVPGRRVRIRCGVKVMSVAKKEGRGMIGFVIGMVVVGLIAGFLARALVPGRDSMSVVATIVLGVIGSFIGGFLADVLFRNDTEDKGINTVGLVGSVIGAVIALLVYRAMNSRRVNS